MTTILKLPSEVVATICYSLSDPQTLKMKQVCKDYWKVIDADTKLQTRIAYRYLLDHQHIAGIPLDNIQYFLQHNRLVVDIKDDTSVFEFTKTLAPSFPGITHLIVRKGSTSRLQDLFKLALNSSRLNTLLLYECELDQNCTALLNDKIFTLYFCNVIPINIDLPAEKTVKIDDEPSLTEKILGEEADASSLNKFQQIISDKDASSDTVLQAFDAMRCSFQAKVISGIWYAVLMDPHELTKKPVREIQRLAREFIAKNPHHPAVTAATM